MEVPNDPEDAKAGTHFTVDKVQRWKPRTDKGELPRDWWESQFLFEVPLDKQMSGTLEDGILHAMWDWFKRNKAGLLLDPYPGACIELYLPECSRRNLIV